jgi:Transposase, Mutator family
VIAYGVHQSGRREVVGLDVGEAETESFWRSFLRSLRARGLEGVQLVISDAHSGLKAAIASVANLWSSFWGTNDLAFGDPPSVRDSVVRGWQHLNAD